MITSLTSVCERAYQISQGHRFGKLRGRTQLFSGLSPPLPSSRSHPSARERFKDVQTSPPHLSGLGTQATPEVMRSL